MKLQAQVLYALNPKGLAPRRKGVPPACIPSGYACGIRDRHEAVSVIDKLFCLPTYKHFKMLLESLQLKQVAKYHERWKSLYLECNSGDQTKVENAVTIIYKAMGLSQPKIDFLHSPLFAGKNFNLDYWGNKLIRIDEPIEKALKQKVDSNLWQESHSQIYEPLHQQLWQEIGMAIYDLLSNTYALWHDLNLPVEENKLYFNPVMDFYYY